MKLTRQEEYGLRCLLQVARQHGSHEPVRIEFVAASEQLGYDHAAKLMRRLGKAGLLNSARGATGGYSLAKHPTEISVWDALIALDEPLYSESFCGSYSGQSSECVHAGMSCTLKGLWSWVDDSLKTGLSRVSLADLLAGRSLERLHVETP